MSQSELSQGIHRFQSEGLTVVYEVRGTGPVCVIHSGGPGVRSNYLRMPRIEEFVTAVYLDPIGTGDSSRLDDGNYSVERYAEVAHRLIRTEFGEPVTFLGHSHGGFVGLQLALDHSDDLSGLALYSSIPNMESDAFEDASRGMAAFVARFPDDPDAARAGQTWGTEEVLDSDAKNVNRLLRLLPAYFADFRTGKVDVASLAEQLGIDHDPNRLPAKWDVRGRLGNITVPTLILTGKYDWICRPHQAAQMWQDIPGAALQAFNASGHFAHLEQPDLFVDALRSFITTGADLPNRFSLRTPQ